MYRGHCPRVHEEEKRVSHEDVQRVRVPSAGGGPGRHARLDRRYQGQQQPRRRREYPTHYGAPHNMWPQSTHITSQHVATVE